MGTVHRLAPTSWSTFVKETLGHPVLVNVTRAQFAAMPPAERASKKRVAFVTPAAFLGDKAHRVYENVTACSLVALDIDDSNQARPFYRQPNLLNDALQPLAFACYTTASSTPEAPKLRIFVPADDLPLASYALAVSHVAARLGLPSINKESKVAVQPMYLPTLFRDDDPIDNHPLIIAVTDGAVITRDLLKNEPEVPTERRTTRTTEANADELDFLRPTVDHITLEDCEDALQHLDPDCTYPEWLEIAAALRHQFPRQSTEAFNLFDSWSAKGTKYAGREDTDAKWKSLRPTPRGRVPVTVRTLLHRAEDSGWSPVTVASKCYNAVLSWLSDDSRTPHELMSDGVRRIAGAPLQSPVERGTLLSRLRDALAKHKLKTSLPDLKRELHRLERAESKTAAEVKTTPEAELPKWAKGICYVAGTNEFYQRHTDRRFSPEVLDSIYGKYLMSGDTESGRPSVRPRDYLLNVLRIPGADHYRYDPSHPEQAFVQDGKKWYVNLYLPTYPEPDADDADYAGLVIHEHLTHLIKEAEYRRVLLDYLAHCVQFPGQKIRWACLLQGAQGCGKTAIAELMSAALGRNNVTIMSADLLFSQFNTWANGAQIVAIEEIRIIGHNRHEVMNKLKPCISNDTVTINGKLKDLRINIPNNANYLMFTNHHDSLAVSDGDRRYFVVHSAIQDRAQVVALGPDYFTRLFDCIHGHGPGLRSFLESHRISPSFNPNGHAPITTYLKELSSAAATPLSAAIADAIMDGDHPLVQEDFLSSRILRQHIDGDLPKFTDQQLGVALREMGYQQVARIRLDDGRHYLWAKRGWTGDATATAHQRLAFGSLL